MTAEELIRRLGLYQHPEGGYFAKTYTSRRTMWNDNGAIRPVGSAFWHMAVDNEPVYLHRLLSDEILFFHQGEPAELFIIQDGELIRVLLGNDLEKGETPQYVVPSGNWIAARVKGGKGYSLVGCAVTPGFDFVDFDAADRQALIREYPHLREIIEEFTK